MRLLGYCRLVHFYGVGDVVLDKKHWDFVVVEFMAAGSLAELLDCVASRPEMWPWPNRLSVLCDVAEGMAQMHAKRYVHRDLPVRTLGFTNLRASLLGSHRSVFRKIDMIRKPDNVLLSAEGRAKIADLGLSRTHAEFDVTSIASLAQRRGSDATEEGAAAAAAAAAASSLTWWDFGGTPQ